MPVSRLAGQPCRACHTRKINESRGLCKAGFADRSVRERHRPLRENCNRQGSTETPSWWPTCECCGGKIARAASSREKPVCSTCQRPVCGRPLYFARIALYTARAERLLPLFEEET